MLRYPNRKPCWAFLAPCRLRTLRNGGVPLFGHLDLAQFNPALFGPQAIVATFVAMVCVVSGSPARILRYLTSWPVLGLLAIIASMAVPMLVIGYIAPCGSMQDTVAAGELLAGRSAYPEDLHPVLKRVVNENPVPAAFSWLKSTQSAHLGCMYDLRLNAHPPLVAVALEPVVAVMGYYKPALLLNAISLASIVLILWLWSRAYAIRLDPKQWLLLMLVLLGSDPFLGVLRSAGMSALLAALVVVTWYLLRIDRDGWAGIVLAFAAGLKLFPLVACGAMLFGRFKALLAVALSGACIVMGIVLLHGSRIFSEYAVTARLDVQNFNWLRSNYSLLANIRYFLNGDDTLLRPLTALACTLLCLVAGIAVFRLKSQRLVRCDFAMALAATLMCLFPPVVWRHYYVVLLLPFCVISYYSRWWERKWASVLFFLIIAGVNGAPVEKLSALVHTDVVSSIPPAAVLSLFAWLVYEALQLSAATAPESKVEVAQGKQLLPVS